MGKFLVRPAIGVPNGSLTRFRTTTEYRLGSVQLVINGHGESPDSWTELGGDEVELTVPPLVDDKVSFGFMPKQ